MKTAVQLDELQKRSFLEPDKRQSMEKASVEVVNLGKHSVKRVTYQPGWKWSTHMKPIAKTDSCQQTHMGVLLSGKMHVAMANGREMDFSTGEVVIIPPGHDGWVVGKEPAVFIDFADFSECAK